MTPERYAGFVIELFGLTCTRFLIFTGDTCCLGRLRRTRKLANTIAQWGPRYAVLVISGSPGLGNLNLCNGADFVRIPAAVTHQAQCITDPHRVVSLRETLLLQTVRTFRPDAIIVDGLTGNEAPNVASFRDCIPTSGSLVITIDNVISQLVTTGTAGSLDDAHSAVAVNL